ncbi:MAG: hypothetical protein K2X66_18665, partial [Cyanobacteria bacterium]|nr:hypothetical protein [Cyanobacteriota bacterium]
MNTPLNSIPFKGVHFVTSSTNTIDPEGLPVGQDEWHALHAGLNRKEKLTRDTADQFATTLQVSTEPFVYDQGKKRVFVVLTERLAELAKSFKKMR